MLLCYLVFENSSLCCVSKGALSLFSLYFRDLVHVQGFSFIFWSWPLVTASIFLSKTFVFSFLLACRVDWVLVCNIQLLVCNIQRLRALVWCVISNLLPRSIKEPFRSLLCHHSIHIPWETWVFWFVSARIIPSVPEHHPRISLSGIRATLEGKCLFSLWF